MASVDLILLGQGPSKTHCPFNGTEVWTTVSMLSNRGWESKPYSKVFIFDRPSMKLDEKHGLEVALLRRQRGDDLEIVGHEVHCPQRTMEYPLKEVIDTFGTYYWKNDMSYMIALAILRGYKHISLWGVDQGGGADFYEMARPFVMYWLGVATGRGVEWDLAPESILLRDG